MGSASCRTRQSEGAPMDDIPPAVSPYQAAALSYAVAEAASNYLRLMELAQKDPKAVSPEALGASLKGLQAATASWRTLNAGMHAPRDVSTSSS